MFLKRPKDIGQLLNSLEGLKYLMIIKSIIGTNPPRLTKQSNKRLLYYLYAALINLICWVLFPVTMLINLFFIDSYKDLVANLSLSVNISMSAIKQMAVLNYRQQLLKSHEYLKLLDRVYNQNNIGRKYVFDAIHSSQLYCLLFLFYAFCGFGFGYNGWHHHQLIYNAWYPDIFTNPEHNYLTGFTCQFFSQFFIGLQSVFNDTYPLCYLSLMIGHLEALAERIAAIGWQNGCENRAENNVEDLKNCIRDHKHLLGFFDCIRPAISITLFLEFLIAGLILCLTAINMTFFSPDFNDQFFVLIYLIIILIQMFPCCWYVSVLMQKSNYLTTAMYSCNWMDQNIKFRKILIIFMQRSQKTNTILAANFTPVTLQTFLSIIRFGFSMFTILSKM